MTAIETCVVVGATGAMGSVITERLAGRGFRVVAVARSAAELDKLAANSDRIVGCPADIGSDTAVDVIAGQLGLAGPDGRVRCRAPGEGLSGHHRTVGSGHRGEHQGGGFGAVAARGARPPCRGLPPLSRSPVHSGSSPVPLDAGPGTANAALLNLMRQTVRSTGRGASRRTRSRRAPSTHHGYGDSSRSNRRRPASRSRRSGNATVARPHFGRLPTLDEIAWLVETPSAGSRCPAWLCADRRRRRTSRNPLSGKGVPMPIAHFHLPAGVATPEQERGLLLDAGEAYSRILESPIERVRVFVVEYDATRVAVGGEIVADGGSVAPYFTAIVLAGRPAGQRRELLATFTDLIVTLSPMWNGHSCADGSSKWPRTIGPSAALRQCGACGRDHRASRSATVISPADQCVFGTSRTHTRMFAIGAPIARCAASVSSCISARISSGVRPWVMVTSMKGMSATRHSDRAEGRGMGRDPTTRFYCDRIGHPAGEDHPPGLQGHAACAEGVGGERQCLGRMAEYRGAGGAVDDIAVDLEQACLQR